MDQAPANALVTRFRAARRDPVLVVLEGFHALKHAVRFGAEVLETVTIDASELSALAAALAPDVAATVTDTAGVVAGDVFAQLAPQAHRTGVIAIARRPVVDVASVLGDEDGRAPVVLLEDPRDMGNVGACVRVAAAAGAAAVLTTGVSDPWQPEAVRGAAGLQFALPVAHVSRLPPTVRQIIAIDPEGDELRPAALPPTAILAFGTERHGLSPALLERADTRVRIPMREGVSSLNLATSVAAVLFAARLADG